MKNLTIYIILAYFALMVQSLLFGNTKPDCILVLVCFFAVRNGMTSSVFYGSFCGLLLDMTSGFMIGPNMISKSTASLLTRAIRNNLLEWSGVVNIVVIAVMSILDVVIVYSSYEIFSMVSFSKRSWDGIIWHVLFTAVAGFILYSVLHPDKENIIDSVQ
jgi:rod shape-determining protein MreD